jgi:hypothetical protein
MEKTTLFKPEDYHAIATEGCVLQKMALLWLSASREKQVFK